MANKPLVPGAAKGELAGEAAVTVVYAVGKAHAFAHRAVDVIFALAREGFAVLGFAVEIRKVVVRFAYHVGPDAPPEAIQRDLMFKRAFELFGKATEELSL